MLGCGQGWFIGSASAAGVEFLQVRRMRCSWLAAILDHSVRRCSGGFVRQRLCTQGSWVSVAGGYFIVGSSCEVPEARPLHMAPYEEVKQTEHIGKKIRLLPRIHFYFQGIVHGLYR